LEGMGKVGKTFTCDVKVLLWLEQYAKKQQKKESAIVNSMLNSAKRQDESWTCPECDSINGRMNPGHVQNVIQLMLMTLLLVPSVNIY